METAIEKIKRLSNNNQHLVEEYQSGFPCLEEFENIDEWVMSQPDDVVKEWIDICLKD
jgi:hypothetical protein